MYCDKLLPPDKLILEKHVSGLFFDGATDFPKFRNLFLNLETFS